MPATLLQIRSDVRIRLDEVVPRMWTDAELTTWINEALRDISRRTETLQDFNASVPIFAGQNKYALPSNIIRIHRLEFSPEGQTQVYTIAASTYQEMDQIWGYSQNSMSSYPTHYVLWGFPPNLTLQLFPVPSTAGNLNIFFYRMPQVLVADTDVAEIPEGWHDLCALYCEYIAKRKDKDLSWRDAKNLYDDAMNTMITVTRQWHDQSRSIMVGTSAIPSWLYGGDE